MALINTLRNKMGKIVVAFIAVAILSFTLNDILGSNSVFMGENVVGKIAGEKITLEEYQNSMDFQERNFAVFNPNRSPSEADKSVINDRAWLWLLAQYAYGSEYQELGLDVGVDEMWDILQGSNLDPTIQAFFADQTTGQFDRQLFEDFYRNKTNPQYGNARYIWDAIYPTIKPSRERVKYDNMMIKSTNVTQVEGSMDYHAQSDVAEVKYIYIPFYGLSDSTVESNVTDAMISERYQKTKNKYKVKEQRSLKYISFPIVPSSIDTLEIKEEMESLAEEFTNVDNDELFASANTDGSFPFESYHKGILPYQLVDQMETLSPGDIIGPSREGGTFTLYKVSDVYEDTVSYSRASHILITWEDETDEAKAEARTEANRILSELKNGSNFGLLARENSKDYVTAQRGGDLGWIQSNSTNSGLIDTDLIFASNTTGLLPTIKESDYGYHIIDITGEKTNTVYAISTIERFITASDRTVDDAYRKADLFQSEVSSEAEFLAKAEADGLEVTHETEIGAMDRALGDLGTSSRGMVQWLYRDGKIDKVSDIFDVDNKYVIAVMTDQIDEGFKPKSEVESQLTIELIRKLKAEYIIGKLTEGSLEEIAAAYGEDANIYESNDLNFQSNSLPNVGNDPVAVGRIFSLKSGEMSAPFYTDNGVFVAQMINLTKAPEVADYTAFSESIRTQRANGTSGKISSLIEREADIEDKRYKVY